MRGKQVVGRRHAPVVPSNEVLALALAALGNVEPEFIHGALGVGGIGEALPLGAGGEVAQGLNELVGGSEGGIIINSYHYSQRARRDPAGSAHAQGVEAGLGKA